MSKAVLFTQCLQNDFVRLIEAWDPLPNALHVGYAESLRLLGERAEEGPLLTALHWAYSQREDALELVHIRDWHNPEDLEEKLHLERFSPHCLRNTPGADFVFSQAIQQGRRHHVVNSGGLNDFHGTVLEETIRQAGLDKGPVRCGITGVWTEAKVSFLAYELTTRYPEWEVGVCSALCAGSSRNAHLIALDQMESLLGVRVFFSVGDFTRFLTGTAPLAAAAKSTRTDAARLHVEGVTLHPDDEALALYIFRNSREVHLKGLDGGFSGNVVLRARSSDAYGHAQVPTVLKMGPRTLIAQERVSFERIQEVLGNNAPSVVDFAELGERGAIQYRYAAMLDGKVQCFQDLYQESAGQKTIDDILDRVFRQQLGRLYDASTLEKINLLSYYDFQPKYADGVDRRVAAILSETGEATESNWRSYALLPGFPAAELGRFYRDEVGPMAEEGTRLHHTCFVHGDLNGRNILVDAQGNVWIIDFFHTAKGHILRDLVKLENDLAFIFTPVPDKKAFVEASRLANELWNHPDLGREPSLPAGTWSDPFQRYWKTMQTLRGHIAERVRQDRSPFQLHVAALRYAVHTLSFDECTLWQKRWALHTAALLVEKIRATHSGTRALRVDWIPDQAGAKIGITILPGRKDRDRDLASDINDLKTAGIGAVASLVTPQERMAYGVENLLERYREQGWDVLDLPIPDGGVPSAAQLDEALAWLKKCAHEGKPTVIHCVGGLGRSGVLAAAWLIRHRNMSAREAIETVRAARSPRAVENKFQENFLAGL